MKIDTLKAFNVHTYVVGMYENMFDIGFEMCHIIYHMNIIVYTCVIGFVSSFDIN